MTGSQITSFAALSRPEPLHLQIADRIRQAIDTRPIPPGDRLPTEHELAAEFGVSRNVIREAIACLRSDGVVDSRQGIGAFVLPPQDRQAIRLERKTLTRTKMRDLFELRAILEIEAAGLAALRADAAQIDRIGRALDRMRDSRNWASEGIEADLDFHRAIADATGNSHLLTFLDFIAQAMRESIQQARETNGLTRIAQTAIAEHTPIHAGIAARDPAAARQAMQDHIRGAALRIGLSLE